MKFNYLVIILFLTFISCDKRNENRSVTLALDAAESTYTDERFLIDSIKIVYGDSIHILRYTGDYVYENLFFERKDKIFEVRERCNEELECFGVDTILTFGKSDTAFIYKSAYDFISIVFQYTLADNKYSIGKEGNMFVTIKQSLTNSTYTEKYYYDESFLISKFVNTYKDNICVYSIK